MRLSERSIWNRARKHNEISADKVIYLVSKAVDMLEVEMAVLEDDLRNELTSENSHDIANLQEQVGDLESRFADLEQED